MTSTFSYSITSITYSNSNISNPSISSIFNFTLENTMIKSGFDDQELISKLLDIDSHCAVAYVLDFFSIKNSNIHLKITLANKNKLMCLFDEYLESYSYTMSNEFNEFIHSNLNSKFNDESFEFNFELLDSELIDYHIPISELMDINPHCAVAYVLDFFSVKNPNVVLKISLKDETKMRLLFDKYFERYTYMIGSRTVEKIKV